MAKYQYRARLFCDWGVISGPILAYRYDAKDPGHIQEGEAILKDHRLLVKVPNIEPWRFYFTFYEEAVQGNGHFSGKALDPRAAVYVLMRVAQRMSQKRDIAFLFTYSEEEGCLGAHKAIWKVIKNIPHLKLVVNVDCAGYQ